MDFRTLKPDYDRDGYVVVRQLLPEQGFAELYANLDRYIRDVVPGLPASDAFYDVDRSRPESLRQLHRMAQDAFFAEYRNQPTWKALAEALIGEPATTDEPEWFNKPPMSKTGTPPHQDNFYFSLKPCNVVTIWMALDRIDLENACLRYVPGSHLLPTRPHHRSGTLGFSQTIADYGPDDEAQEVPIHLQPGDVMAHHGNLIHRAGANVSTNRHRRAFAMVYKGVSCRRDEEAFAKYQAAVKAQHAGMGIA